MKKLAVIGGGASGLCAAIEAGRTAQNLKAEIDVTIFERNPRVGKKLLLTGNGHCNLTNEHLSAGMYNTPRAMAVIRAWDGGGTRTFFEELGIPTRADEAGRVYPHSMQASCVVNALRGEAERLGIFTCTDMPVDSIRRSGRGFTVNGDFYFDGVIIACGGCAYPVTGSDGSGFRLLESLGIACAPLIPVLTGLQVAERDFKSLKGIRARASVRAVIDGKVSDAEYGEVQFAEYGISGIAVMQLSRQISRALSGKQKHSASIVIDLAPDMELEQLSAFLQNICRSRPSMQTAELLGGVVPRQLGFYLLKRCGIPIGENRCANIPQGKIREIAAQIKGFRLRIDAVRGFEQAQLTAGGADLRAFDGRLMARRVPGLFACGEVLDVDGACGGYNLEWAFSSGRLCGKSAAEFLTEDRS